MRNLFSLLLLILLTNSNIAFCSDSDSTSSFFDDENFTWWGPGPLERGGIVVEDETESATPFQSGEIPPRTASPTKYFSDFPTSLDTVKTVLYLRIKGAESDTLDGRAEYVAATQALDLLLEISNITEEALYQLEAKGIESFNTALENLAQDLEGIASAADQKAYLKTAITNIESKAKSMVELESR